MKQSFIDQYNKNIDNIKGWFNHKHLLNVYKILNDLQQDVEGDLLEIGVLHGKSFIPLIGMSKGDEVCIGIDIFEDQIQNIDSSGGMTTIDNVKSNIRKVFETLPDNVILVKNNSQELNAQDLSNMSSNGNIRLISIDGCHTMNCTLHDLRISAKSISDNGIIIIDDYTNMNWPGVKAATDQYLNNNTDLQPIYSGCNKLILCTSTVYETYYHKIQSLNLESNNISHILNRHKTANMWKGVVDLNK